MLYWFTDTLKRGLLPSGGPRPVRRRMFEFLFKPGRILTPFLFAVSACGGGDLNGGGETPVRESQGEVAGQAVPSPESWELSSNPVVEIGVREGEDDYQLHRVRGSVRLEDGRIVVLNAGSQQLRFYDSAGRFLDAVGGPGEGPGEFRNPAGLRRTADGGLQVWDGGLMRVSIFEADGTFRGSSTLLASGEEMFPGDDWILGQNWIVSPVPPGARDPIRRGVEAMPAPDSLGALRILRVTSQGRIWSPRGPSPVDTPVEWDVFRLDGTLAATITVPARFQPHEIGDSYITGAFLDEVDVTYVRVYELRKPPKSPPGPGLELAVLESRSPGEPFRPAPSGEVLAGIRSLVKTLASLQEIHYSDHFTYTKDLEQLFGGSRARVPGELQVEILFAGSEGWAGMVTHPESKGRCVLSYGFFVPMGWQPGAVICL